MILFSEKIGESVTKGRDEREQKEIHISKQM